MRVAALAGGVGGAKLVDGLNQVLKPEQLTIIVNTGDDFRHLGLYICPDLDTVCYTLAGIANPETGYGRADDSYQALENIAKLGGPNWFRLGDRDLGLQLERTRRLHSGDSLSQITQDFCWLWGVRPKVLPMSDEPIPTRVLTEKGELAFQEYFVYYQCRPAVKGFEFVGCAEAKPAPGVLEAIGSADVVIISPSNPWVSIDPILSVPGVREEIQSKPVIAISPIIGGRTIKGPAAKMYAEMGIEPSAMAVCHHYREFLAGFVIDEEDKDLAQDAIDMDIKVLVTHTIMQSEEGRQSLAKRVIEFAAEVMR